MAEINFDVFDTMQQFKAEQKSFPFDMVKIGRKLGNLANTKDYHSARKLFLDVVKWGIEVKRDDSIAVLLADVFDVLCSQIDSDPDHDPAHTWGNAELGLIHYSLNQNIGPVRKFFRKAIDWDILYPSEA